MNEWLIVHWSLVIEFLKSLLMTGNCFDKKDFIGFC